MKRSLELRQKRAQLVEQANALIPAEGRMSGETQQKFDAIMADVDGLKADIDRVERAEAASAELQQDLPASGGAPANPGQSNGTSGEEDPRAVEARSRQYRQAFGRYLRRGLNNISTDDLRLLRSQGSSVEYRDLDNTSGPAGGFLVPQGFQNEIDQALKQFGGMRQAARVLTTATGNQLPWPTANDTGVVGRRLGANAVGNPAIKKDTSFGRAIFNSYTYTSDVIAVPNELMQDSAFGLESYLREIGGERIGRIQNTEFTTLAPGSGGPGGLLPQARVAITAAGQADVTFGEIINLQHSVDPAYRPGSQFMFNDDTLRVLRQKTDLQGRPLFTAGIEGGAPDRIAGSPFVINQDFPHLAAGQKSMAYGRFDKYVIRDVAGSLVVVRLNELYALNNETGFVVFTRSDGQLIDAGMHPISVLQQAA